MEKTCVTCHQPHPASEFNKRQASKDGLQDRCRSCSRAWYEQNRAAHVANVRRNNDNRRRELRQKLVEYLESHLCVDCGENDIRCLEFDHLDPLTKTANVTRLINNAMSWQVVLDEINKCVVRCANCHRRRTALMFQTWRLRAWLDGEPDPFEEIVL